MAESSDFTSLPENTVVISFCDSYPGFIPVSYKDKCRRVFYVNADDLDICSLSDYGMSFETYFPEAKELAQFIVKALSECSTIICQCEYGQSRSAACAAAILEFTCKRGIEIFADYRSCPNQLIFNKLLAELKNIGNI